MDHDTPSASLPTDGSKWEGGGSSSTRGSSDSKSTDIFDDVLNLEEKYLEEGRKAGECDRISYAPAPIPLLLPLQLMKCASFQASNTGAKFPVSRATSLA